MATKIFENNSDYNISIQVLRKNTRLVISNLLNPVKVIPTEKGLTRDWNGLAELTQVNGGEMLCLKSETDPTNKVLEVWDKTQPDNSTIKNLLHFLVELDRFDIIDDITSLIDEDIACFKQNTNKTIPKLSDLDTDKCILTRDDVVNIGQGLPLQNYDAFVLFADEDINFATELIETMEKQYNMKFCVKYRDLVGGSLNNEAITKFINERCNRLIVIISAAFLDSPANKFFCSFIQFIGFRDGNRKIIPCLFEPCKLPTELNNYFILDYRHSCKMWNFWDKLYESVQMQSDHFQIERSISHHNELDGLKPALHRDNTLRPKKGGVKFNSMVNLNTIDSEIMPDSSLNASTSLNTISTETKKHTSKNGWLKKFLNNGKHEKSSGEMIDKHKKRFWSIKRKAAAAN